MEYLDVWLSISGQSNEVAICFMFLLAEIPCTEELKQKHHEIR